MDRPSGGKPAEVAKNDQPAQQPGYQPPQQQPSQQTYQQPQHPVQPPQQPAGPSRQEVLAMREHIGKLHVRADVIRQSMTSLRNSMQAQGHSPAAKFTQPEAFMNTYLKSATDAVNANDLVMAKEYADKAESQIEILEKLFNL
jgi:hypothetical protein